MNIWQTLLYQPLLNALILFYNLLGQNLGLAIIGLTLAIRFLLTPLTKPSLEASQKMRKLSPELEKLKKKHKGDKQALAQAQLELYRKHGVNPGAGCLPQIVQIIILIALFQAFNQTLAGNGNVVQKLNEFLYAPLSLASDHSININFLYLKLTEPDLIKIPFSLNLLGFTLDKIPGLFLISAALTQFLSSKLMLPEAKKAEKAAKKTKGQEDDMAAMMQKQMLFLMPLMTLVIGFSFASGLVLYWLTFSSFMLVQQLLLKNKKE
jgi:YidC/Oxa1 family membrane protein insertase